MKRRPPSRRTRAAAPAEAAPSPSPQRAEGEWAGLAGDVSTSPVDAARSRPDRVFMPTGYEPGYAYPLLVWLPDREGARFDLGRVMTRVSLRNHVAVEPAMGEPGIDVEAAVWQAIDRIRDRVRIHPQRIFLLGQGRGGTEAFRIACRHATAFAGVVSIGGAFPHGEGLFGRLDEVRRLPMLFCCRRESPAEVLRPTDATLRLFHAAGAMLAMRIYPGRNDLSKTILGDVNRWLMDEICGATAGRPQACGR